MKRHLTIAAAAAALFATPAFAGAPVERVQYRDLNLATAHGQAELQDRLDKAARRVCRFDEDGMLRTAEAENACYRVARKTVDVRFAQVVRDQQLGG